MNGNRLIIILLAALVLLLYAPSLRNGFVADDIGQVQDNVWIRSLEHIPRALTSCIWESANRGCYGRSFYYRPLHVLSYIFTYQISPAAWVFHAVQLLYTFIAVCLVYRLGWRVTGDRRAGVLAAALVAAHPINSEVAVWISATPEVTFAIFSLLATLAYLRYREVSTPRRLGLVYAFYALAVLSKEPAVLLPIIFVVLDWLWFGDRLANVRHWPTLRRYLPFAGIFIAYVLMRRAVLGMDLTDQLGLLTGAERLHSMVLLFGQYVTKLFWPYPLNFFHLMTHSSNFASGPFLATLLVTIAFGVLLWWCIKTRQRVYVLGLVWFAVFLSPVFIYLGGVGTNILSERYLFVPGMGIAIAAAAALMKLWDRYPQYQKVSGIVALGLLIASAVTIWARIPDWKNNVVLFSRTLEQSPDAHELRRALAETYFIGGQVEEAKREYEELLRRAPEWEEITMVYKGLGDYYQQVKKDNATALTMYERAAATARPSPRDYVTFNNLGVTYMEAGRPLRGVISFCQASALLPDDQVSQTNFQDALNTIEQETPAERLTQIEDELQPIAKAPVQWLAQECEADECHHTFAYSPTQFDILLPSLITGKTTTGQAVLATEPVYTPGSSSSFERTQEGAPFSPLQSQAPSSSNATITLTTPQSSATPEAFLFPTCSGTYYNVAVGPST